MPSERMLPPLPTPRSPLVLWATGCNSGGFWPVFYCTTGDDSGKPQPGTDPVRITRMEVLR